MSILWLLACEPCPDDPSLAVPDTETSSPLEEQRSTVSAWDGWVEVATGRYHTCVLDIGGRIVCSGCETALTDSNILTEPIDCTALPGSWSNIAAGLGYTCASGPNGTLCNTPNQPPSPLFDLAMGTSVACGFTVGGAPVCWPSTGSGPLQQPLDSELSALSATSNHQCGIRADHTVACWGAQALTPPDGQYQAIDAKADFHCALNESGVDCWGRNALPSIEGTWESLTVGYEHACVYNDTEVRCWGATEFGPTDPIEEGIVMMDAGLRHTCAVRKDGHVECWGDPTSGAIYPP
jgi:alpha-tubulin suppressor-like RCC1 family protein